MYYAASRHGKHEEWKNFSHSLQQTFLLPNVTHTLLFRTLAPMSFTFSHCPLHCDFRGV